MLFKQVKQYGADKRQRIDINKSDDIPPGDINVVIFTEDEYTDLKQDILDLQNEMQEIKNKNNTILEVKEHLESQIEDYKNQQNNLKEIVRDVTEPIRKELQKKDDKINELETKLDAIELKFNEYNLELNGLNGIEMILLRRHKSTIKEYSATINTIIKSNKIDKNIVDADVNTLTDTKQHNNKSG